MRRRTPAPPAPRRARRARRTCAHASTRRRTSRLVARTVTAALHSLAPSSRSASNGAKASRAISRARSIFTNAPASSTTRALVSAPRACTQAAPACHRAAQSRSVFSMLHADSATRSPAVSPPRPMRPATAYPRTSGKPTSFGNEHAPRVSSKHARRSEKRLGRDVVARPRRRGSARRAKLHAHAKTASRPQRDQRLGAHLRIADGLEAHAPRDRG
jgi:hypothetical protein